MLARVCSAASQGIEAYPVEVGVDDRWYGARKKNPDAPARSGLFDLFKDPGEKQNLIEEHPAEAKPLAELLAKARSKAVMRP